MHSTPIPAPNCIERCTSDHADVDKQGGYAHTIPIAVGEGWEVAVDWWQDVSGHEDSAPRVFAPTNGEDMPADEAERFARAVGEASQLARICVVRESRPCPSWCTNHDRDHKRDEELFWHYSAPVDQWELETPDVTEPMRVYLEGVTSTIGEGWPDDVIIHGPLTSGGVAEQVQLRRVDARRLAAALVAAADRLDAEDATS